MSLRNTDYKLISLKKQSQINPKSNDYINKKTIYRRFVYVVSILYRRSISINKLCK